MKALRFDNFGSLDNLRVEELVDPPDDVSSASIRNIKTNGFVSRVFNQFSEPPASLSFVDCLPRITYQAKAPRKGRLSGPRPVAEAFAGRTGEFDKNLEHPGVGVLCFIDDHDALATPDLVEQLGLL